MDTGNRDIVVLNVGGTLFTSSVTTLTSSSSYFARRLSEEWREQDSLSKEQIVIDQDPRLFSVLLSFMRLGSIDAEQLTTPVILLAMFFGMDKLLEEIRNVAIRWKFEERNSTLFLAAQAAGLVQESDVRKKFAMLSIYHPDWICFREARGVRPDFVVCVDVEDDDGMEHINPSSFTFIDALNFLSKSGYIKYEEQKSKAYKDEYNSILACLWFSKLVDTSDNMEDIGDPPYPNSYKSESTTIFESGKSAPNKYPREYCYILDNDAPEFEPQSILEADVGREGKPVAFDGQMELLPGVTNRTSRSSILNDLDTKLKKFNWLQSQGYTTREDELANIYHQAIKIFMPRGGEHFIVSVWSRPSSESY